MSDSYDELAELADIGKQNFGPAVELALQQLARELAAVRADRERLAPPPPPPAPPEAEAEPVAVATRTRKRRGLFKKTLTGVGVVIAALVVAIVLLISVGPKVAPYQTYFVRSASMEPTFNTGDLIVLGKVDGSDIKKGDIITFERPDKQGALVTHRVVAIETTKDGRKFETQGDANNAPDAWRVPASGTGWKYKFRIQKVGYVFGYLSTPAARLALLAVPAVLLGLLSLIDIWKPQRSDGA